MFLKVCLHYSSNVPTSSGVSRPEKQGSSKPLLSHSGQTEQRLFKPQVKHGATVIVRPDSTISVTENEGLSNPMHHISQTASARQVTMCVRQKEPQAVLPYRPLLFSRGSLRYA